MNDHYITARRFILFILIGAPVFSLFLNIYWHYNPQIAQHFYAELPEEYEIIEENHNTSVFDGSVSWLIKSNIAKKLHLDGYAEISYSADKNSKYHEVQAVLENLYPDEQALKSNLKILVGGSDENKFVGIFGNKKIILYKF